MVERRNAGWPPNPKGSEFETFKGCISGSIPDSTANSQVV